MTLRNHTVLTAATILAATMLLLALPAETKAAGTAVVTLAGPTQSVSAGQQFSVYVNVTPNNAIAGAQFSLSFNPSLVTVNAITEGNLLNQNGAATYFLPGQTNNQAGTVSGVAGAIVSPGQTVSAPGTLAVLKMTASNTPGTCQLNLSGVIVGDASGHAISVNVAGGQVVISPSGTQPQPTAPPPTAPSPGGGGVAFGGGGGGGGGVPAGPGVTYLGIYTNGEGLFNLAATANSEDGKVQVKIAKGVQGYNKDGTPLKAVTVTMAEQATDSPGGSVPVGAAYDFGPDGATFSPPIVLSINYDPSALPAGVAEKSLAIVSWDPKGSKWVEIDSALDEASHAVTAAVSHFSRYRIVGHVTPSTPPASPLPSPPELTPASQPVPVTPEVIAKLSITRFSAVPAYGSGLDIASVGLTYELASTGPQPTDAKLVLKVGLNGQPAEEVILFSGSVEPSGSGARTWDYVPSTGWVSGTYSFQAELYSGGALASISPVETVRVQSKAPAAVDWNVLLLIIAVAMLVSAVTTVLILRRRREYFRSWAPDDHARTR